MTVVAHALPRAIYRDDAHAEWACSRMTFQATGHQTVEIEYAWRIRRKLLLLGARHPLLIRGIIVISHPQAVGQQCTFGLFHCVRNAACIRIADVDGMGGEENPVLGERGDDGQQLVPRLANIDAQYVPDIPTQVSTKHAE